MGKISIFNYLDYRQYLKSLLESKKNRPDENTLTQARLAEKLGLSGGFMSKVLAGRSHFNEDQLYHLSRILNHEKSEAAYLNLLGAIDRCQCPDRKNELLADARNLQSDSALTEQNIQVNQLASNHLEGRVQYYLEPEHMLVHIALSIPEYSKSPDLLADRLRLGDQKLKSILKHLETLGLIEYLGDHYRLTEKNLHLSQKDELYPTHQIVLNDMFNKRSRLESDMNFSMFMSCHEADREKTRAILLRAIDEIKGLAAKSREQELVQLRIDLVNWL